MMTCVWLLLVLIIYYFWKWHKANTISCRILNINNSTVEIKTGDIFKESGRKAIAFNEYFDTLVDDKLIASKTLNGKFIENKVKSIIKLDEAIKKDAHLKDRIICVEDNRKKGKNIKYKLGSIYVYEDEFLLTAFSKFDKENKAYLSMSDYLEFLINFWSEIDRVYAGQSIVIPLFGSGITRICDYDTIQAQELLEILIWSFKISRIKVTYPAQITIIIDPIIKNKINFYDLKGGNCSVL